LVEGVRITPPIQGRGTIGIEVPNQTAESIVLRELMETESYASTDCALPIVIGKDSLGKPVILDLAKTPHMLMAGATGMGKSVGLNAILLSILMCKKPWEVKMLMIDPKAVELDIFNDIPHMMHPIVTDMAKAKKLLDFCVWEMDRRYKLMRACRVRNIREYNALDHAERCNRFMPGELDICDLTPYLPYIVLVVEEWADLYNTNKEEAVEPVQRIAQKARAAGIHMILTTQNPTVKCLPGLIKSNVPTRLAYRVGQRVDSQVILDAVGAEKLVHRGEFLLKNVEGRMTRGQGAYVSTEEVETVADFLRCQGAPEYDQDIQEAMAETCDDNAKKEAVKDNLFFQAVELLLTEQRASTSILQRRMGIGYNRAARLVDLMHKLNIVGPVNGAKPRDILVNGDQWAVMKLDLMGKDAGAAAAAVVVSRDEYADFDAENSNSGGGSFSEFEKEGRRKINGDISNDEIADDNGGEKF
ncbi:MAG: FtsK/SpoIIIE domain-containing protein, partial [Planctomycetota bacterium]